MQLLPTTAKAFYDGDKFSEKLLFVPENNVSIGCKFLRYLFEKYLEEITVLACYNAGEGVVRGWMGEDEKLQLDEIEYQETRNYVEKIEKFKRFYLMRLNVFGGF